MMLMISVSVIVTVADREAVFVEAVGAGVLIGADPEGIGQQIVALCDDPDRGAAMSSAAQGLIKERYEWQVIAQQLVEAYQSVV